MAAEQIATWLNRARQFQHQGQESLAENHYRLVLGQMPQHPAALYELGVLYREQEQLTEAYSCFEALEQAVPNSFLAAAGLAQTALVLERPAESRLWFERARQRRQADPHWAQQHWKQLNSYPDLALRLDKKLQHELAYLDWLQAHPDAWPEGLNASELQTRRTATLGGQQRWLDELRQGPLSLTSSQELEQLLGQQAYAWTPPNPVEMLGAWSGAQVQNTFLERPPHYAVIDDALSPELLNSLYAFGLRANVWQNYLHGLNYLCAYPQDGINLDVIYALAAALRERLPGVLGAHSLKKFWMYRYASNQHQGVQLHADSGAVNLNLWLTPNQGNTAQDGGLLLYDVPVPLFATDAEFFAFNRNLPALQQLLRERKARAIPIPYRQNRLVIFDANLLHQTMPYHFEADYPLQRVNLTLMFGRRGRAGVSPHTSQA